MSSLKALVALVLILIVICWVYADYKAVEKYYPGMTFWEYTLIGSKLRITPGYDR